MDVARRGLGAVGNKSGPTRLGFALMLKFFEIEAQVSRGPRARCLLRQWSTWPSRLGSSGGVRRVSWCGRTVDQTAPRAGPRRVRVPRVHPRRRGQADGLAEPSEVCPVELRDHSCVRRYWCAAAPSGSSRPAAIERIIGSARAGSSNSSATARSCVLARRRGAAEASSRRPRVAAGLLAELKADPGRVGLETLLREIEKLGRSVACGCPPDLFADASEKLVEAWRARATRSYPSDLRAAPRPVRLTLLAALCWVRQAEITDAPDGSIDRAGAQDQHARRSAGGAGVDRGSRRVRGKEAILFRLAEAAVEHPDEIVRRALFPVVGERHAARASA